MGPTRVSSNYPQTVRTARDQGKRLDSSALLFVPGRSAPALGPGSWLCAHVGQVRGLAAGSALTSGRCGACLLGNLHSVAPFPGYPRATGNGRDVTWSFPLLVTWVLSSVPDSSDRGETSRHRVLTPFTGTCPPTSVSGRLACLPLTPRPHSTRWVKDPVLP